MKRSLAPSLRKFAVIPAMIGALALSACGGGSLGSGSGGSGEGGADGPVKVGISVPKSGVYAALGKDMEQGFKLYLEEKGNKLGGKDIELVETDEGAGPQTGVPATEKLITADQASVVVGIVNSATAAGLKNTFNESKVPLIVTNAGADTLTEPVSDYILPHQLHQRWRRRGTRPEGQGRAGRWLGLCPGARLCGGQGSRRRLQEELRGRGRPGRGRGIHPVRHHDRLAALSGEDPSVRCQGRLCVLCGC